MTREKLLNVWKIKSTFTYNIFEGKKYNKNIIWWKKP